ncbi:hypothetical protein DPMN_087404 [Dreissena polymorpha]|uniref:Uncharacterized protein n=1 Tax=Dreissena polymorpha TaxID=45954 RepID=A0A9D4QVG5_DREPO|nr:hypothetical protein DPMN_087404 [Dreissena polymorpha]
MSISENCDPDDMKEARVKPLFKKGSPQVDEEEFLFIGRSSSGIRDISPFKSHFKTNRDATEGEPLEESTSHLEENGYFQPVVLDILVKQYLPLVCLWSGLMLNVDGQSTTKSSGETSAITRDSNAIVEIGQLREYAGDSELDGLKTTNEGVADARESWSKKRKKAKKGPRFYAANATAVPKQPKESKSGAQIKTSTPTEAECPYKIEATNLKLGAEEIPEKVIEKNIGDCFTLYNYLYTKEKSKEETK